MDGSTILPARFREFVHHRTLLHTRDRLVVAVSGGVDSVVLLHLLAGERERLGLTITVAHFNHGLRPGDADEDAAFVTRLATQWGFPVTVGSGSVREEVRRSARGVEDAARTLRYAFLEEVRVTTNSRRIATGHNADDNAETVLLNLLRGSGVRGLAGIPVTRNDGQIVRPLLFATREEILAFAAAERMEWREDASNASDAYRRNIVRHDLLPIVREKINPGVAHTMLRTAELFGELDQHLTHIARTGLDQVIVCRTGQEVHISCSGLLSFPTVIQHTILHLAVEDATGRRLPFDRIGAIAGLIHQQSGRRIELGGQWTASRTADAITIGPTQTLVPFFFVTTVGEPCIVPDGRISITSADRPPALDRRDPNTEYVDAECTGTEGLVVRTWIEGDAFIPLGMTGHKNVSDLLNEAGIASIRKAAQLLLTTSDGEIVWVCGIRIGERFKVTTATQRILQLTYQRSVEDLYGEAAEDQW